MAEHSNVVKAVEGKDWRSDLKHVEPVRCPPSAVSRRIARGTPPRAPRLACRSTPRPSLPLSDVSHDS